MTKDEKTRIKNEILDRIRQREQFTAEEFRVEYNAKTPGEIRTINLLLHEAMEEFRKTEGVGFGVMRGTSTYSRQSWKQIESQAKRQRAAGQRKRVRAAEKLRLAAELAPGADSERLSEMADREALRNALARRRVFETEMGET